jgi:hypothetical protein
VTKNKQHFQLMAFLENGNELKNKSAYNTSSQPSPTGEGVKLFSQVYA